jgi:multidrug resistance efflux pump
VGLLNVSAELQRFIVTLVVVAAAAVVARWLWVHYELEPWTRDGRVRAYVVQVAPDVSGLISAIHIVDNQRVLKGEPLFEIDQPRFTLALQQAEAALQAQQVAVAQAEREAVRNRELRGLVSREVTEQSTARVDQARAALSQATVARDLAKLNLERTRVVAPVNGVISNLDLRVGDYVTTGRPALAIIDADSLHVEGYFEETKLPRIHVGDAVTIKLMGERELLNGHVQSIARGIADRDRSSASDLLPNVNPTFNWVRLAQRIPVYVEFDRVPPEVRLVAGQTATVTVIENADKSKSTRTRSARE